MARHRFQSQLESQRAEKRSAEKGKWRTGDQRALLAANDAERDRNDWHESSQGGRLTANAGAGHDVRTFPSC
jgi:hypothetical protein